ncbi:MAG TPA: transcriptional repressor, partial [Acidobacteriota bacterium]|nr:transcriptional repressor [Acidobacteriota bacterium]
MSKVQDELAEQVAIFASYLRENGLRMTRQRETIVRTFLSSEGHLSTEELYDLVKRVDSRIGYATVFRT